MKQIMMTDTNNKYYQNTRLNVIVYNILEHLQDFRTEEVHVRLCEDDDPTSYIPQGPEDKLVIDVCNNIFTHSIANINMTKIKNLQCFMDALGISLFNQSLAEWVFILLHELGHGVLYKRTCINIEEINLLNRINENEKLFYRTMFNYNRYEGEELTSQQVHNLSGFELFADNYAFNNFPMIWNMLTQRGLV